ncbi:MAG: FAD-dependent oxidoreductase, partial [Nanoarchaeota archaeon]
RMPSLYLASDLKEQVSTVKREFEARKEAGFEVELLSPEQLQEQYAITAYGAMVNREGFCLNPVAFCQTMAEILEKRGVRIYEQAKIIGLDEKRKSALTLWGNINYQKLVLTNSSPSLENNMLTGRALLLSTVAAVTEPLSPEQYHQTFKNGEHMGWDAPEVDYMYFRPVGENRLLIGGSDRLTSLRSARNNPSIPTGKDAQNVRKLFEKTFPHLCKVPFSHVWSGIIPASIDSIPFAGEYKPDHYVGLYSPGLPNAFNCGRILAQFISGETPETRLLDEDRKIPFANRIRTLTKYEPFTTMANNFYFS